MAVECYVGRDSAGGPVHPARAPFTLPRWAVAKSKITSFAARTSTLFEIVAYAETRTFFEKLVDRGQQRR